MHGLNRRVGDEGHERRVVADERDRASRCRICEREVGAGPYDFVHRVERDETILVKAELGFHLQEPTCGVFQAHACEPPLAHGLHDRTDRGGHVLR